MKQLAPAAIYKLEQRTGGSSGGLLSRKRN